MVTTLPWDKLRLISDLSDVVYSEVMELRSDYKLALTPHLETVFRQFLLCYKLLEKCRGLAPSPNVQTDGEQDLFSSHSYKYRISSFKGRPSINTAFRKGKVK